LSRTTLVAGPGTSPGHQAATTPCGRPNGGGKPAEPPAHYELRVQTVLDSRWSAGFEGLRITSDQAGQTTIASPLADQAALQRLLARIRDWLGGAGGAPHRSRLRPDMEACDAADSEAKS
jgi:hypothetical protein